ncbi:hypothetical protein DFP72DRAFT_759901, partial [Ephemerocybe angulata]
PVSIIDAVEHKRGLNARQRIAYRIIIDHFIQRFIIRNPEALPLRMLMTGPGGTGKTYVVNSVKQVMKAYGSDQAMCYLAPTGSAAALIDGMTIHKGLGLKIENFSVLVSIQNLTKLRNEWKHVDILFIDEASLLSAKLLCEIDYAL